MINKHNIGVVIVAGGVGKRYGSKKQFELLLGKEIWRWSYDSFLRFTDKIVVVGIDCPGGETRQESVRNGLQLIDREYVLIHDAARPLVQDSEILAVIEALSLGKESVTVTMPNRNTIVEANDKRVRYLDRESLKIIATPQGFRAETIKKAHSLAKNNNGLDDCQLVKEYLRIDPHFIMGGEYLHKLTFKEDLKLLEFYANQMQCQD